MNLGFVQFRSLVIAVATLLSLVYVSPAGAHSVGTYQRGTAIPQGDTWGVECTAHGFISTAYYCEPDALAYGRLQARFRGVPGAVTPTPQDGTSWYVTDGYWDLQPHGDAPGNDLDWWKTDYFAVYSLSNRVCRVFDGRQQNGGDTSYFGEVHGGCAYAAVSDHLVKVDFLIQFKGRKGECVKHPENGTQTCTAGYPAHQTSTHARAQCLESGCLQRARPKPCVPVTTAAQPEIPCRPPLVNPS